MGSHQKKDMGRELVRKGGSCHLSVNLSLNMERPWKTEVEVCMWKAETILLT